MRLRPIAQTTAVVASYKRLWTLIHQHPPAVDSRPPTRDCWGVRKLANLLEGSYAF